jgi:dTDP-4-dehydrorhamnose reductase
LDLLLDGEGGIWHVANDGAVSWAELAQRVAELAGVSTTSLSQSPIADLGLTAARPASSVLKSERAWIMPTLDDALLRFLGEAQVPWARADAMANSQMPLRESQRGRRSCGRGYASLRGGLGRCDSLRWPTMPLA